MASPAQEIVKATELPNTATTLYTSPAGIWTQISRLSLYNSDGASHAVTIYLVPAGASAAISNQSTAQTLIASQTWNSPNEEGHTLNPGDALAAFADTGGLVNIFVAGVLSS